MSDSQITPLFRRVQNGRDEDAIEKLWNAYYERLLGVSRRYFGELPKRIADEEDVALSAMNSFFDAAENGRLNAVQNRDELWRILITITLRKANRHKERVMSQKRGGGGIARGESGFFHGTDRDPDTMGDIPDGRIATDVIDECRELIGLLPESTLRNIAVQRLAGSTVEEIATDLGVASSTVKRKIRRIRGLWSKEIEG